MGTPVEGLLLETDWPALGPENRYSYYTSLVPGWGGGGEGLGTPVESLLLETDSPALGPEKQVLVLHKFSPWVGGWGRGVLR